MLPIYIKPVFFGIVVCKKNASTIFVKHIWSMICYACNWFLTPARKIFFNQEGRFLPSPPSTKVHIFQEGQHFLIKCLNFFCTYLCTKYVTSNKILLHFQNRYVNFIGEQFPSFESFEKVRHQVLNSNHHITLVTFQMKGYSNLTTFIYMVYSKVQGWSV